MSDAMTPAPSRIESAARLLILVAIGGMAGAAAFTHVHDLTVAHGQPEWIGWANATALELMSVYIGLELRRRRAAHAPTGFAVTALGATVALSLAVQVAEAEPSVWGWIVAAIPAVAFLVLVKLLVSTPAAAGGNATDAKSDDAPPVITARRPEPDASPVHTVFPRPAPLYPPPPVLTGRVNGHRPTERTPR